MASLFDPFDALFQFQQALDSFRTSGWLDTGYPFGKELKIAQSVLSRVFGHPHRDQKG